MRHDGHDELRKHFHEKQNNLRSKVVEEDAELWLLEGIPSSQARGKCLPLARVNDVEVTWTTVAQQEMNTMQ